VDWYPWGEQALQQARRENEPILLSIGYSACHWCHVMAREPFEDPVTDAVMSDPFVSIPVDREERPYLGQDLSVPPSVHSAAGRRVASDPFSRSSHPSAYFQRHLLSRQLNSEHVTSIRSMT
jgi:hypothetical protein